MFLMSDIDVFTFGCMVSCILLNCFVQWFGIVGYGAFRDCIALRFALVAADGRVFP